MTTNTPLSLFVSSKMQELADERRAIQELLSDRHMFSWLWEENAGARPEPIRSTYLKEVEACDIYIGLFWLGYGQYTIEEYEHARLHKKPCLVYEKRVDVEQRSVELTAFLNPIQRVENAEGLTVRWFTTPQQLAAYVQEDVMRLLTTTFRESRRQPALAGSSGLCWLKPPRQVLDKNFVGRQQEVDMLLRELSAGESVAIVGRPVTQALQGMAGIGKTYLALKLAIDLYDHFPAGVIRLDLGQQIKTEADVQPALSKLASWAFNGVAPPGPLDCEQVAAWLTEAAPGRLLVLFDDAWHRAPLQTLNRALPAYAVRLVTTRSANVAQSLGGKTWQLDRLSPSDGLALLEDRLHCHGDITHRVDLESLVALLGGHALALDIAAARIKTPARTSTILHSLQKGIGRGVLDGLKFSEDDERDTNLEKSLALSYNMMRPEQQLRFRTLGIFVPEAPILPEAVAAVWNMQDTDTVQENLFDLADLALLTSIEQPAGITYRQHNLLQLYACALAEKANELYNTHLVLAQYYSDLFAQAEAADNRKLIPHELNVLAALHWTADNESSLFLQILSPAAQFLHVWGQSTMLETYLPEAIDIAIALNDKRQQANLLQSLGDLESRLGNIDQARAHYDAALPLYRAERARLGEANLLQSLGDLESRLGNIDQARAHYDAALPLYRAERARWGEADVLKSLGDLESRLGNIDQARAHYDAALPLYRLERGRLGEANVLKSLGDLERRLGNIDQACAHYDAALPLYRLERDRLGEANVLKSLGDLESRLGNIDQARAHYDAALPLYRLERGRLGEANVLKSLGDLESRLGNIDQARAHYDAALPLYRAERARWGEAYTYQSLGYLFSSQEDWRQAKIFHEQALSLHSAERDPLGQAGTLYDLGRARFELGEREQGMQDVQRAAELFRSVQDETWAGYAEQRLTEMQKRIEGD